MKRKCMMATVVLTLMMTAVSGCGNEKDESGGAGIDKAEASFAEVQEGTMLEAQGSFEGEEFVAKKVIIEIYK